MTDSGRHGSASLSTMLPGENEVFREQIPDVCDAWIHQQITDHLERHSEQRSLRLRVCTFNVNGQPPGGDLSWWILGESKREADKERDNLRSPRSPIEALSDNSALDIVVIGFQELDLSAEGMVYNSAASEAKVQAWSDFVHTALLASDGPSYHKLATYRLSGIVILVFCTSELAHTIAPQDVEASSVRTGLMGLTGNKGAVGIALNILGNSARIHFVNSHLAAQDELFERRNADYQTITEYMTFRSSGGDNNENVRGIFDCDALFWLGDLNYRLDLPPEDVRTLIREASLDSSCLGMLQEFDQLKTAQKTGRAFISLKEAPIYFLPTYRFANAYPTDSNGYDMERRPAWTDRILYATIGPVIVTPRSYNADFRVGLSDHKPVAVDFALKLAIRDHEVLRTLLDTLNAQISPIYQSLQQSDNLVESSSENKLKLTPQIVDFGYLGYDEQKEIVLDIVNEGSKPCAWRWVSYDGPTWLHINQLHGIILPRSKLSVKLTVDFNSALARTLGTGDTVATRASETIILHDMYGVEYFVLIDVSFHNTCYGQSIDTLVRLPCAIRERNISEKGTLRLLDEEDALNSPRELMRLIEWLMSRGVEEEDIFFRPGDKEIKKQIRECLDTGESFDPLLSSDDVIYTEKLALSFGAALVEFIGSLRHPFIPADVAAFLTDVDDKEDAFEILTAFLPHYLLNSFISLTAFLHFLAGRPSKHGEYRPMKIANVFAPLLLRDDMRSLAEDPLVKARLTPLQKRRILLLFIS